VLPQSFYQGIESDATAWTGAQIFVHDNPRLEWKGKLLGKDAYQSVASPNRDLAATDAGSRANECELSQIAVRPNRKRLTTNWKRFARCANEGSRLIETD